MRDKRFFVHDDIEILKNQIPIAFYNPDDRYIMQEDRVVYIGDVTGCEHFMISCKDSMMFTSKLLMKEK